MTQHIEKVTVAKSCWHLSAMKSLLVRMSSTDAWACATGALPCVPTDNESPSEEKQRLASPLKTEFAIACWRRWQHRKKCVHQSQQDMMAWCTAHGPVALTKLMGEFKTHRFTLQLWLQPYHKSLIVMHCSCVYAYAHSLLSIMNFGCGANFCIVWMYSLLRLYHTRVTVCYVY